MKTMTLEELSKDKVQVSKPEQSKCPMRDCYQKGNYVPCYFDTCCLCPIYQAKYERLSPEQRMVL